MTPLRCCAPPDIPLAEWLLERGIGEDRAALIVDGAIARMVIERASDGARAGAILPGRLLSGRDRLARLDSGEELLVASGWRGRTDGAAGLFRITRMALPERDLVKRAIGELLDDGAEARPLPDLQVRLGADGTAVRPLAAHGPDRLEGAGWSEAIDAARSGLMPFAGGDGLLRCVLTPAMTVFDVDGTLPGDALALAGADAAARAIIRYGITGNIVIDLPSLTNKEGRKQAAERFDATMEALGDTAYERTAVNGFGLLQLIRRRSEPSIPERVQFAPIESAALALLRRAERAVGAGALTLAAHPEVIGWLSLRPALIAELERRTGRTARLQGDAGCGIDAGHAQ